MVPMKLSLRNERLALAMHRTLEHADPGSLAIGVILWLRNDAPDEDRGANMLYLRRTADGPRQAGLLPTALGDEADVEQWVDLDPDWRPQQVSDAWSAYFEAPESVEMLTEFVGVVHDGPDIASPGPEVRHG